MHGKQHNLIDQVNNFINPTPCCPGGFLPFHLGLTHLPETFQTDRTHMELCPLCHVCASFLFPCFFDKMPVQEVTEVVVVHFYRGTWERLRHQVGVDPHVDGINMTLYHHWAGLPRAHIEGLPLCLCNIVIQVLSRDMLKEIRDKDGDKIQGTLALDASELVSFLFSPPYIFYYVLSMANQWNPNLWAYTFPCGWFAFGRPTGVK